MIAFSKIQFSNKIIYDLPYLQIIFYQINAVLLTLVYSGIVFYYLNYEFLSFNFSSIGSKYFLSPLALASTASSLL